MKRPIFIALLCLVTSNAYAATTVTVDSNENIAVSQPVVVAQPVAVSVPAVITREAVAGDFEGRIVGINYPLNQVVVREDNNNERLLTVTPDVINSYRVGDYVIVHPTADVTVLTMQDNPKDFEGDIIRVDMSDNQLVVLDTNGRERKVQLKQGMIGTYKVDDYVRIHLMEDLKEAKTIETLRNVRNFEGRVVSIDSAKSVIVVRDTHDKEAIVIVRQGLINNYSIGQQVRIYTLPDHNEAQLIRVIR